MFRFLNVFVVLFLVCSCAHKSEAKFRSLLTKGQCEQAVLSLPNFKIKKVSEYGLTSSSATASIALTSAAYGYDLIYFVVGGMTIPTLSCMPAGTDFIGSATLYEKCFERLHTTSDLGRKACPDLSFAVDQLLDVAQCYEKRGDASKAREQRELLLDENAFGGCVSEEYKTKISQSLEQGN